MKKLRWTGNSEIETRFGIIPKDKVIELSDKDADNLLQNKGWEWVREDKKIKKSKKIEGGK